MSLVEGGSDTGPQRPPVRTISPVIGGYQAHPGATIGSTGSPKNGEKEAICLCPGTESNCLHTDFQSVALPVELPGRFLNGASTYDIGASLVNGRVLSNPSFTQQPSRFLIATFCSASRSGLLHVQAHACTRDGARPALPRAARVSHEHVPCWVLRRAGGRNEHTIPSGSSAGYLGC
jgi:hypothetical protein